MTREESGRIVAYLNAVFPREALEPATVAVWVEDLTDLKDGLLAMKVAQGIGRTLDRMPSLARFRMEYLTAVKQRADTHGLPSPEPEWVPPPPEAADLLKRMADGTLIEASMPSD